MAARPNGNGSKFEIYSVKREASLLTIGVEYSQTCSGEFDLIWSGIMTMSYPSTTTIVLKLKNTCEESAGKIRSEIKLDLKKFMNVDEELNDLVINVSNGSTIADIKCEGMCVFSTTN